MKNGIHLLNEVYHVYFSPGQNSLLRYLIAPSTQYIYAIHHCPVEDAEWRFYSLPISSDCYIEKIRARGISYHFIMSSAEFLENVDNFSGLGINIFQSPKELSENFYIENMSRLNEPQRTKILLKNGITSEFFLPHDNEVAMFWHKDLSFAEEIVSIEPLKGLILANTLP